MKSVDACDDCCIQTVASHNTQPRGTAEKKIKKIAWQIRNVFVAAQKCSHLEGRRSCSPLAGCHGAARTQWAAHMLPAGDPTCAACSRFAMQILRAEGNARGQFCNAPSHGVIDVQRRFINTDRRQARHRGEVRIAGQLFPTLSLQWHLLYIH